MLKRIGNKSGFKVKTIKDCFKTKNVWLTGFYLN